MPKVLGIDFAPLSIPLERRLQMLAVIFGGTAFFGAGFWVTIALIWMAFTPLFFVPLLYLAWMVYDKDTFNKGGRLSKRFRRCLVWKYYAKYFPATLHKTVDLDPSKNYIFGYHPHGIIGVGAFLNFATDATGFSKLFPGITTRLVTLVVNFWTPINRETMLFSGLCSANRESIEYMLSQMGPGNAVVIVVGGAAESLDAVPHTMDLTLKNRKGFVKLAIKNGASLVPCISFGENEIFSQQHHDESCILKKIQRKLTHIFTVAPPIFHGRGVFQYNIGLLPYRKPMHTIVGRPIDTTKNPNPTREEVERVHTMYMEALEKLFEENKEKYAENPNVKITFK